MHASRPQMFPLAIITFITKSYSVLDLYTYVVFASN
jgi:hypothetical protein